MDILSWYYIDFDLPKRPKLEDIEEDIRLQGYRDAIAGMPKNKSIFNKFGAVDYEKGYNAGKLRRLEEDKKLKKLENSKELKTQLRKKYFVSQFRT